MFFKSIVFSKTQFSNKKKQKRQKKMKIFSLVFLLALFLYQVNGACVETGLVGGPIGGSGFGEAPSNKYFSLIFVYFSILIYLF
jgi:hypothetical protein